MKAWDVIINGQSYHVELKGSKIAVNGTTMKLKDLKKERKMHYGTWEIPLGGTRAILYGSGWLAGIQQRLVMDGRDVATGEEYRPVEKLPVWAYIFIVLHAVNLLNGAFGACLAVIGITATISISANEKFPLAVKLLLSLALLVIAAVMIFGMAVGIGGLIYG